MYLPHAAVDPLLLSELELSERRNEDKTVCAQHVDYKLTLRFHHLQPFESTLTHDATRKKCATG